MHHPKIFIIRMNTCLLTLEICTTSFDDWKKVEIRSLPLGTNQLIKLCVEYIDNGYSS